MKNNGDTIASTTMVEGSRRADDTDAPPQPVLAGNGTHGPHPFEDWQRAAIREQLDRVVSSPAFRNGRRYPAFLKYIIEETLAGRGAELKERTVGIAVFQREPDYDTSEDHIVRSAAAEIRKRLAQYYQPAERLAELRIEVPTGSYVPQFHYPDAESPDAVPPALLAEGHEPPRFRIRKLHGVAALALIVAGGAAAWALLPRETALDRFWKPVVAGPAPVLICIANNERLQALDATAGVQPIGPPELGDLRAMTHQVVHMEDVVLLAKVVRAVTGSNANHRILTSAAAAYEDLQASPAVLIGGRNTWMMRALQSAPIQLVRQPGAVSIADSKDPKASWSPALLPGANPARGYGGVSTDYALIGRFRDPQTNHMVVTAAGVLGFGAVAAGVFLTDEAAMRQLDAAAPAGWKNRNLQVVLAVDVVKGVAGRPRIVHSRFW